MKRYNYFILSVVILYIISVGVCTYAFSHGSDVSDQAYLVDVKRIMKELETSKNIEDIDDKQYSRIESVEFFDERIHTSKELEDFYTPFTNNVLYQPYYIDQEKQGMLKFTYRTTNDELRTMFFIIQGSLFIFMFVILAILFYLKRKLIVPFMKLKDMPYELSQGHFKEPVQIAKSSYLNEYLRGMSQLKDTLQITKKRQYELEKEKKQLLLSISHDIKTPINLIKLYTKALRENVYETQEEKQHAMYQIDEKCEVIEAHVNEIMKQSREDILDIKVVNTEFYLHDLIKNITDIYQDQCALRHIQFVMEPSENRILKGDMHRAQEVLENLFENAFKYGDGRLIQVSFYEEEYCQLIRFYNSGEGVQTQESMHLFDSFYRGSNAQGIQGSGLGLYICKHIMRKMDGDIFWETTSEGMAFVLVFH